MSVGFAVTLFLCLCFMLYLDVVSLVVAMTPVCHRILLSLLEYNHF